MLPAWRGGTDHVGSVRVRRDDESWLKHAGTRWFYRLVNAGSSVAITPDAGDFRLLDRCVAEALRSLPERNRFMKARVAWVGFRTVEITDQPLPRGDGASTFSTLRLIKLALTGITAFSNLPLWLWSALGGAVAWGTLVDGARIVVEHVVVAGRMVFR